MHQSPFTERTAHNVSQLISFLRTHNGTGLKIQLHYQIPEGGNDFNYRPACYEPVMKPWLAFNEQTKPSKTDETALIEAHVKTHPAYLDRWVEILVSAQTPLLRENGFVLRRSVTEIHIALAD